VNKGYFNAIRLKHIVENIAVGASMLLNQPEEINAMI